MPNHVHRIAVPAAEDRLRLAVEQRSGAPGRTRRWIGPGGSVVGCWSATGKRSSTAPCASWIFETFGGTVAPAVRGALRGFLSAWNPLPVVFSSRGNGARSQSLKRIKLRVPGIEKVAAALLLSAKRPEVKTPDPILFGPIVACADGVQEKGA